MRIPEDPLDRRKWMLKLWREDYGARFSVFDPEDQPAPELESWQPGMWEPYDPEPDQKGNHDPKIIRHIKWFEDTKRFLKSRYEIVIGPDLFFDCKAMQRQGSFSKDIRPERERLWYIKALRIGIFLFEGKLGIGFSCRSRSCQRTRCPLNLKRLEQLGSKNRAEYKKRWNRVDLYQLMQIFEGEKVMPMTRAVEDVSIWFSVTLRITFGEAHYAVPRQSVYRQIKRYQKDIPTLIRNFTNLCKRSPVVHFEIKPPSEEVCGDHFFFPLAMITGGTLTKIDSPAVVTYLYLWMLKTERAQENRFKFSLPRLAEMEKDTEARGFRLSGRTIQRHLERLEAAQVFDKFSGPIL